MKLNLLNLRGEAILYLSLVFLLVPFLIGTAITFDNPLVATTIWELIDNVVNFIFYAGVAIFPIMVIVAAFLFLSSGGDPAKVGTAKKIFLYSLIGLMIVLLARGIIALIYSLFGV